MNSVLENESKQIIKKVNKKKKSEKKNKITIETKKKHPILSSS